MFRGGGSSTKVTSETTFICLQFHRDLQFHRKMENSPSLHHWQRRFDELFVAQSYTRLLLDGDGQLPSAKSNPSSSAAAHRLVSAGAGRLVLEADFILLAFGGLERAVGVAPALWHEGFGVACVGG